MWLWGTGRSDTEPNNEWNSIAILVNSKKYITQLYFAQLLTGGYSLVNVISISWPDLFQQ